MNHLRLMSESDRDHRMNWWRESRLGMFIHWGLYAIPAGEWKESKDHAEWIRTTGQISIKEYDRFVGQFNPVKFDAEEWVKIAKETGMRYITITSKHHDGFCLFDSQHTDFDIMSTPFKRDILKELAEACKREGIKLCFYYSIMDWHHPDYLPRRNWEKNRSAEGTDFDRYVTYMKKQLKELLTHYGDIGVLWFDGEWEKTWTHERGVDLYHYLRGLQPSIIINNRVDKGCGMHGLTKEGGFMGDFATPEQEIPSTGWPGVDWESCMTMNNNNNHWGYNKHEDKWKSAKDLIRELADITSKGGNYLLNVGPKADGTFPEESVVRLKAIGEWMKVNSEAIYGTTVSPFEKLMWGCVTQKFISKRTRLYLHVFDWPADGKLPLRGIANQAMEAGLLARPATKLSVTRKEDALVIDLPPAATDAINSVLTLDIEGKPKVINPPETTASANIFIDQLLVKLKSKNEKYTIRYTLDGTEPHGDSPEYPQTDVVIDATSKVTVRFFNGEKAVSGAASREFRLIKPIPAKPLSRLRQGVRYAYYEGEWDRLPEFSKLKAKKKGVGELNLEDRDRDEYYGFRFIGYIEIPEDGVYHFYTVSDDGSRLSIDSQLVVDNDGLRGRQEREGQMALQKGYHSIEVTYFERTGGSDLELKWGRDGVKKVAIPMSVLYYR